MYHAACKIVADLQHLLPELDQPDGWKKLAGDYSYYPTAHLGRALTAASDDGGARKMAALFYTDPVQLQLLSQPPSPEWTAWLEKQLAQAADQDWMPEPPSTRGDDLTPFARKSADGEETEEGTPPGFSPPATLAPAQDELIPAGEDAGTEDIPSRADTPMVNLEEVHNTEELPEPEPAPPGPLPEDDVEYPQAQGPAEDSIPETSLPPIESAALKAAVAALEAVPEDSDMLFEPFHTVDYFASQGIQTTGEIPAPSAQPAQPQMEQKLRSFTQWLKAMKKIDFAPAMAKPNDPAVDAQALASLDMKTVVTEAMAEVLIKQGKKEQAGYIYTKLMLLHPEKSTYFAARLNALKQAK